MTGCHQKSEDGAHLKNVAVKCKSEGGQTVLEGDCSCNLSEFHGMRVSHTTFTDNDVA